MQRFLIGALILGAASLPERVRATEPPETKACTAPAGDLGLRPEEDRTWTACEKWAWSCIREGKEANLYEKLCLLPRTEANSAARRKWEHEAFLNPSKHADASALGDQFLQTILWLPHYANQIPPHGVRIFGGYFKDLVDLENVTTTKNLVIDGSILKQGVRLTNFRTEKNVSFDGSNIRGSILLLRAHIDGSVFLEKGIYDGIDMRDARIGSSVDAAGSVFNDVVRLDRAHIEGRVDLIRSRLTTLNAWDAYIGGSLELRLADVRVGIDMTGTTVAGDLRLQRLYFGRHLGPGAPSCDWDTSLKTDYILQALLTNAGADKEQLERIKSETVLTRPLMTPGRLDPDICVDALKISKLAAGHELLLRDTKIKGTLCLIDVTGEIAPPPGSTSRGSRYIATVSLDGAQANSTVLRWKPSYSNTLWHAVNFKTGYMLINAENVENQPHRHFLDNIDVGSIAFVRTDPNEPKADMGDEDFDKYLCDVTPAPYNAMAASSHDVHQYIVKLFTTNEVRSAQPFAKIVDRLEESGTTSTFLKKQLSEYRLGRLCRSSTFSRDEVSWREIPGRFKQMWQEAPGSTGDGPLVESNRLIWDGVCSSGMMVYKYAVSYGHEPYNLFYYALLFIGIFWLFLRLDNSATRGTEASQKLGLTYAVDTFIPLAQLRLNRRNATALPNSRLLRFYLRLHRFAGVVFAVLVFLFIYRVAK
jgi:hypothetical protein